MRYKLLTAAVALASLAALTGCSKPSGRTIEIEMTNFKLSPATVEVKVGEQVQFHLVNKSDTDHEFESDGGKFEEVVVPGGKDRTVSWTAPAEAGKYEFECDMAGHDGMEMEIKVTK